MLWSGPSKEHGMIFFWFSLEIERWCNVEIMSAAALTTLENDIKQAFSAARWARKPVFDCESVIKKRMGVREFALCRMNSWELRFTWSLLRVIHWMDGTSNLDLLLCMLVLECKITCAVTIKDEGFQRHLKISFLKNCKLPGFRMNFSSLLSALSSHVMIWKSIWFPVILLVKFSRMINIQCYRESFAAAPIFDIELWTELSHDRESFLRGL